MKNRIIYWDSLASGVLKLVGGVVLSAALPTAFGVSLYKYCESSKTYDNYINNIQSTTEFQEFRQDELTKLEEKLNNFEIEVDSYNNNKEFVKSNDFVVNYAENNYPDIYQGILKSASDKDIRKGLSIGLGALTVGEVLVAGAVVYGTKSPAGLNILVSSAINDFIDSVEVFEDKKKAEKKKLKKVSEDIPEVDLE